MSPTSSHNKSRRAVVMWIENDTDTTQTRHRHDTEANS